MAAELNPDQLACSTAEAAQATEPRQPAPEVRGRFADELVETEIHRGDPVYDLAAQSSPRKTDVFRNALPVWREINLNKVVQSPAIEAVLRSEGIVRIHRPSTGIAEIGGLRRLAYLEPILVAHKDGRYICLANWELVVEAREKLYASELFPVSILADVSDEEMFDYVLTEQIIKPLRNQMSGPQLASSAPAMIAVAKRYPHLFARLTLKKWAELQKRSHSWLKHLMARHGKS